MKLKQKIFYLLICIVLSFAFSSCGNDNSGDGNNNSGGNNNNNGNQPSEFSTTHNISADSNYVSGGTSKQPLPNIDATDNWNVVNSNPAILDVTIDDNQLVYTPKAKGDATVTITKGGRTWYVRVHISKHLQTISSSETKLDLVHNRKGTVNISEARGTGNWSITSSTPNITTATIDSNGQLTITAKAVGITVITISKTEDNKYFASNPIVIAVNVRPAPTAQNLIASKNTVILTPNNTSTVDISGWGGSGIWSITSDNKSIATATITNSGLLTITAKAAGDTTITISKAGDNNYSASDPITITVNVGKGSQTLLATNSVKLVYDTTSIVAISGAKGTGEWSVTSDNKSIATATIDNNRNLTITAKAIGDTTITVSKTGDNNYFASGPISIAVNVGKASQTLIALNSIGLTYDSTSIVAISGAKGTGEWSIISDDKSIATATIDNNRNLTITAKAIGDTTITVSKTGDNNYFASGPISIAVNVGKASQTLIALNSIGLTYDSTSIVAISGAKGTGDWSVTSAYENIATATMDNNGNLTITAKAIGDTTITVSKAGDSNYFASAPIAIAVNIGKAPQNLNAPSSVTLAYDSTNTVNISGGKGGGNWSISGYDTNIITANIGNNGSLTIITKAINSTSITVSKAGDSNYFASSITIVVEVGKADQNITAARDTIFFNTNNDSTTVSITGWKVIDNNWSINSENTSVATASINNPGTLTITSQQPGVTTIQISKAGNNNYFSSNVIKISVLFRQDSSSSYPIATASGLQTIGNSNNSLSAHYIQTATIDLSSITNFKPIGTYIGALSPNRPFKGSFNGNGFKIIGLNIDTTSDYIGLFGYVVDATLENIRLEDIRVRGTNNVGGLAGYNQGAIIGSYTTGSVRGVNSVGGLIGVETGGTVTGSYSTSSVRGDNRVGGLVGDNNGTIQNIFATGSVQGNYFVGGLVGSNGGRIIAGYSTSFVKGKNGVGGLAGYNGSNDNIAGIIIRNSFATGSVYGETQAGGLVGYQSGGTALNSYWNRQTSGILNSNGGVIKTNSQMLTATNSNNLLTGFSSSFWDFVDSESYPVLIHNIGDTTDQQLRQVAGMIRLSNATGDSLFVDTNFQQNITIDTNTVTNSGNTLFVLDTNAEADNNSNCNNSGNTDTILTTTSVSGTNIELRFGTDTSNKDDWRRSSISGSCAVVRGDTGGSVPAGDKLNLDAVISKGTGTEKRTYTKKFSITFE